MTDQTLAELLAAASAAPALRDARVTCADEAADKDPVVSAVEHDSRAVSPGALFCCVPGATSDGHDYASEAEARGAVALLCERQVASGLPQVRVASVRAAMGPLASAIVGNPSAALRVVGVTGTNGKTTTTHLLASVLRESGLGTTVIGTLGGTRTTPEAPELQRLLADARDRGGAAVAMEVSSHALDQHRVDGIRFEVAAFTNLSRDHLDYHQTMSAYFQAKSRLFEPDMCERAVVNLDDPHGRLLRDAAHVPTVGYARSDAHDVRPDRSGTTFVWRGVRGRVPLAGAFNLSNALGALTIAGEMGIGADAALAGLEAAAPVPGRFEVIDEGQPFLVAVDFAHTPDGLDQLLAAARELAGPGKVIVVFGAGGERDRSKRPLMGEVASNGADRIFLTSDNPRGEDPLAIIDEVRNGMHDVPELRIDPDRREAISEALLSAAPGDVVVIAGKGHETMQLVGGRSLPFDDRAVVRDLLAAHGYSEGTS